MIMKDFDHCNVLKLKGISFEDDSLPIVILPYMQNGDLLSYIRDADNKLTIEDLINFAIEVAEGRPLCEELYFSLKFSKTKFFF